MTPLPLEAHAPDCPVTQARWADWTGRDPREHTCSCAQTPAAVAADGPTPRPMTGAAAGPGVAS
jgi:hypothetical protein